MKFRLISKNPFSFFLRGDTLISYLVSSPEMVRLITRIYSNKCQYLSIYAIEAYPITATRTTLSIPSSGTLFRWMILVRPVLKISLSLRKDVTIWWALSSRYRKGVLSFSYPLFKALRRVFLWCYFSIEILVFTLSIPIYKLPNLTISNHHSYSSQTTANKQKRSIRGDNLWYYRMNVSCIYHWVW